MELRDVRLALHRHWAVALAAFLAILALGAAAAYLPAKTYRATSTVVATPDPVLGGNPVQVATFQVPAIIETLQSRSFYERVQRTLPPSDGGVSVSARADVGTGIIRVSVEAGAPSEAARWATALATTIVADNDAQAEAAAADESIQQPLLDLALLDVARLPSEPASPQPVPILLGSAVLAVMAALLTALVAFRATRALDVAEELRQRLGAPILGQIPVVRRLRRMSVPEILEDGPPQLLEAFRSLRTNVELAFHGDTPQAIAVGSWNSGEGKSTVAAGLALSLANVGSDVVLVDGDLRRPSMHVKLGEPFGEGLADAGRVDAATLMRPTRHDHLAFVPAGIPDRHPADVLSVALPRAVASLAQHGRLVVIDAPPIHGVAEAPLVMSVARNLILVVDAGNMNLVELEQAVARLRASGVTLVGVVISRARRARRVPNYQAYASPETGEPDDRVEVLQAAPAKQRRGGRDGAGDEPARVGGNR